MSGTWKQSHQYLTDAHISEIKGEKREGEDAEATSVKREKLFSILTAQRKQLDWRDLAPFEKWDRGELAARGSGRMQVFLTSSSFCMAPIPVKSDEEKRPGN